MGVYSIYRLLHGQLAVRKSISIQLHEDLIYIHIYIYIYIYIYTV